MAKKPSSRSKRKGKPVENSAVKGGGIMSINKSHTSPFMKVVLIIIIVSMITLFTAGGIVGLVDLFKPQPKAAAVDPVTAIKNEFEPKTQAFTTALASSPTSYTLLVGLANARYDYALKLMQLVSQGTSSAAMPAVQQWTSAKDAFAKAYAMKKTDKAVGVDYSVAVFYSGDTTGAVKLAAGIVKADPTFPPAHYNLGIFYDAMGNSVLAIDNYRQYLALDLTGKYGSPDYAKQRIQALGGSASTTGSPVATGSAPTTP
jgi:hypothetical protein